MEEIVPRRKVLEVLKIHYQTLYKMVDRGEIEVVKIGTRQLYNLSKYLKTHNVNNKIKKKICYCRVSSNKHKEDLSRQIEQMKKHYKDAEIISDIGSGLNYERKGLKEILEMAINGEIEELIIAYKDRLTRFGFEMIEWIIKQYSGGKIIILNKEEELTPTQEITKDLVTIMNVYVAKVNGLRKYKKKIKNEIKKG
jgi:putative resolvase